MGNLLYINLSTAEVEILHGPYWSDEQYIVHRFYTQLKKAGRISHGDKYAMLVTPAGAVPDLADLKYEICRDVYAMGRGLS